MLSEPGSYQQRLDELLEVERRVARLRDRQAELEVERIDARASRSASSGQAHREIDAESAANIVEALERLQRAESSSLRALPSERDLRLQEEAISALVQWLEVGGASPPRRTVRWSEVIVACVFFATVAASYFVHLAFLIILLPLSAMSRVLWRGDDGQWLRVAARRRFEQTGVGAPAAWQQEAVLERLTALRDTPMKPPPEPPASDVPSDVDRGALRSQLVDALVAAGLSDAQLDPAFEAMLRATARSHLADRELASVTQNVTRLRGEVEALRATIYSYLREAGIELDGKTDNESLRRGLARLIGRTSDD